MIWVFIIIILIIIIVELSFLNKIQENFENIKENIGNYLCSYFYNYTLSIFDETDFIFNNESNSDIIKYLPSNIPYDPTLKMKFKEHNITKKMVEEVCDVCIWYCDENWKIDMWQILKPTIHSILDKAIKESGLKGSYTEPVIHFRCADTPFIKHEQYFFQNYKFFDKALEQLNEKNVLIMANTIHDTENKQQVACSEYANKLKDHIISLGYQCKIVSKTNVEDFADLFYSLAVISTGSSFSFMSGFFGDGIFITTEHCKDNQKCDVENEQFIKGYNISHNKVDSYYDLEHVSKLLNE
jgi:hypothetical protein